MRNLNYIFAHISLLLMVLCIPAHAQNYPNNIPIAKCSIPENSDTWSLEPSETVPGEYLFKYTNNLAKCSDSFSSIAVIASDGFKVIMSVEVGVNDESDERITVWPEDLQYMAYPPELVVPDSSETYEIRILPGIS